MRRLRNLLFFVILVLGALAGISYLGARTAAGRLVGSNPPMFGRSMTFDYKGVKSLPGTPRAWVISYSSTRLPGVKRVLIYVSPKGRLIASVPANLEARISAYEKSLQP